MNIPEFIEKPPTHIQNKVGTDIIKSPTEAETNEYQFYANFMYDQYVRNEFQMKSPFCVPDGYYIDHEMSDFKVSVYENLKKKEAVISYRGTASGTDMIENGKLILYGSLFITQTQYYETTLKIINKYKNRNKPYSIKMVGHSLGGSIIQSLLLYNYKLAQHEYDIKNLFSFDIYKDIDKAYSFNVGFNPLSIKINLRFQFFMDTNYQGRPEEQKYKLRKINNLYFVDYDLISFINKWVTNVSGTFYKVPWKASNPHSSENFVSDDVINMYNKYIESIKTMSQPNFNVFNDNFGPMTEEYFYSLSSKKRAEALDYWNKQGLPNPFQSPRPNMFSGTQTQAEKDMLLFTGKFEPASIMPPHSQKPPNFKSTASEQKKQAQADVKAMKEREKVAREQSKLFGYDPVRRAPKQRVVTKKQADGTLKKELVFADEIGDSSELIFKPIGKRGVSDQQLIRAGKAPKHIKKAKDINYDVGVFLKPVLKEQDKINLPIKHLADELPRAAKGMGMPVTPKAKQIKKEKKQKTNTLVKAKKNYKL